MRPGAGAVSHTPGSNIVPTPVSKPAVGQHLKRVAVQRPAGERLTAHEPPVDARAVGWQGAALIPAPFLKPQPGLAREIAHRRRERYRGICTMTVDAPVAVRRRRATYAASGASAVLHSVIALPLGGRSSAFGRTASGIALAVAPQAGVVAGVRTHRALHRQEAAVVVAAARATRPEQHLLALGRRTHVQELSALLGGVEQLLPLRPRRSLVRRRVGR